MVTNDEMNAFFDEHEGENFVRAKLLRPESDIQFLNRIRFHRIFTDCKINQPIKRALNKLAVVFQKPFVNRIKFLPSDVYMGDNWFSITHGLADYVVENEQFIRKHFRNSFCADELLLPTLAMMSPYNNTVTGRSLRFVDWSAGGAHPKTFTIEDYDRIMNSGCIFARKFSVDVDKDVIDKIYKVISK